MKTIIAAIAAASACLLFAACSSLPTAQQQFATGCTVVNGELTVLSTSTLLSADQQGQVKTILAKNKAICTAGAQLNVADLKDFHDSLLPAAITIVEAFPSMPNQSAILFGLQAFGPVVQGMVDQVITATTVPAAAVPASGAIIAPSAPVAASGTLVA